MNGDKKTQRKQSGFTLIEIAIVLVIIGLLLGGVLKGQELINSAKVKNLAGDFKNIPVYIYGYQDKFRSLPGDDSSALARLGTPAVNGDGDSLIEGTWDSITAADESVKFWQHVRLAGLATGSTVISVAGGKTDPYFHLNASGGRVGVESGSPNPPIFGLKGSMYICSEGILGKFVTQLDTQMDNGTSNTGAMMAYVTSGAAARSATEPAPAATITDASSYTVCMGV